ncbi:MAG: hypothetical protein WD227_02895 [Vicinamibacterales bacterium]
MEQRRLRLGDILDDYCPRERRVTNHAVVAMIEEDVKQTRCTTCDAEHVYKGGKEPRRRSRKDSPEGLFHEVLAGMPEAGVPAAVPSPEALVEDVRSEDEVQAAVASREPSVAQDEPPAAAVVEAMDDEAPAPASVPPVEEGPIHRRLIRAQLPRPEGQKEVRQVPDFTIRSNNNGRGHFRGMRGGTGQPDGNGHGAGNRPPGRRFGGGNPGRPGGGRGPSTSRGPSPAPGGRSGRPGFGPSTGPGRGPRKRSR